MKKLNVLFLSLVAFGATVTSCSKDDDAPKTEGKWIFKTVSVTQNGETTEEMPYVDANCTGKVAYLDLKAAGAAELSTVNGSDDETDPCGVVKTATTWKSEKNVLKLTMQGKEVQFPIVSLSADKLVMKLEIQQGVFANFTLKR